MTLAVLDPTTRLALIAAAHQQAQCEALVAPWAGGNVTALIYGAGNVLRDTVTLSPFTINSSVSPRRVECGTRVGRTHAATGGIVRVVFRSGSTDVFSIDASSSSGASVNFAGLVKALCAPRLSGVAFLADAALPPSALPSWVTSMAQNTWAVIPATNTLADLDPAQNPALNPNYVDGIGDPAPWNSNGAKHPAIFYAWNGASSDPETGQMQLGPAGGHADYGGNEIYRVEYDSEAPTYVLLRPPSGSLLVSPGITLDDGLEGQAGVFPVGHPFAGNLRAAAHSDGRPRSIHTYGAPFFWPGVGHGMAGLPAQFSEPGRNTATYPIFIGDDGEHVAGGGGTFPQSATIGMGSCYDPTRDCLWVKGNGNTAMHRYARPVGAIQTGSLQAVGSTYPMSGDVSLVYLPGHDCILAGYSSFTSGVYGFWLIFDCATGTWHEPSVSGTGAMDTNTQGRSALHWVPELGAVCAWNNSSNRAQITRITMPANPRTGTLVVDTLPVAAGNSVIPTPAQANGTYGRFIHWRLARLFILLNNTNHPGFAYRY